MYQYEKVKKHRSSIQHFNRVLLKTWTRGQQMFMDVVFPLKNTHISGIIKPQLAVIQCTLKVPPVHVLLPEVKVA